MKSALFVVVIAFLFCCISFAQVPSIAEGSTLQSGPHTWKRMLQNQSTSPLVAYTVGCKPSHDLTIQRDALLDGRPYLGPGRSVEVEVNEPSSCNVGVRAAIFYDGHAEGDPEFVGELFARRRGAYQASGQIIRMLALVYTSHVPLEEVSDRIKLMGNGGKTQQESEGYSLAVLFVKRALTYAGGIPRTPSEEKLHLPAVEDVMRENGFSREEADAFLLSKRLEAWKALLENHMGPPTTQRR
jgi:hypothetical protein